MTGVQRAISRNDKGGQSKTLPVPGGNEGGPVAGVGLFHHVDPLKALDPPKFPLSSARP